jgi:hypothetical protein
VTPRRCAALVAAALAACAREHPAQDVYARQVAQAIPIIEHATGLRFKRPPEYRVRSRAQVRAFLDRMFDEDKSARDLEAQQIVMRRLGIIPDTLDLRALMLDLYTEQVAGFYDPKTKLLYVVEGSPPEVVAFLVQHELVHALQDQYVNLDSLESLKGDDDRVLAAQAVMEGQATLVPLEAALPPGMEFPGGMEAMRAQVREGMAQMPVLARAPKFIQETLIFPYLNGMEFMRRFQQQRPGRMPYGTDLPVSSSQIMHARDYFGVPRKMPVTVRFPAPRAGTVEYDNDVGEFGTRVFFDQVLGDAHEAIRAATGWTGDRYALLRTPQGEGLAWLTVLDSASDAAEFAQAMQRVVARRYPGAGAPQPAAVTHFAVAGRAVMVWSGAVAGRAAVLYVDVPAGARTDVFDLAKIQLN